MHGDRTYADVSTQRDLFPGSQNCFRGIYHAMIAAPLLSFGATLRLTGDNSSIEFGSAVVKATCSGASIPIVTYIHKADADATYCPEPCLDRLGTASLSAFPDDLVVRAHLGNVATTCVGLPFSAPCASAATPLRKPLFTCEWNPANSTAKVTTGPIHAEALNSHETFVDCVFPQHAAAHDSWEALLGGSSSTILTVTLTVKFNRQPLTWAGEPGEDVVTTAFHQMSPPPPLPPPPPRPPSPPPPRPPYELITTTHLGDKIVNWQASDSTPSGCDFTFMAAANAYFTPNGIYFPMIGNCSPGQAAGIVINLPAVPSPLPPPTRIPTPDPAPWPPPF